MSNNSAHIGGYMALFAVGTLIGGAVAMLYAPRSGRATRHLLARGARDLKNKTTDTIEDVKERFMDKVAEVKTAALHM
ncbi:MAG: YtxH domain-containing protein [Kiritimatiellia bacterium]